MGPTFRTLLGAAFFACSFGGATAQTVDPAPLSGETQPSRRPSLELATLRLQYGFSFHRGSQADVGPGLSFNGTTGSDLAVWATAYPTRALGVSLALQREGFVLYDDRQKVTDSSLYRVSVGPSLRWGLGVLSSQTTLGYGYAQLPSFGLSSAPVFRPGRRDSLILGEVIGLRLPLNATFEARAEFPIVLSASDGRGASANSSGFVAGAALGVEIGRWRALSYGMAADYQFMSDWLESTDRTRVSQTISRVGFSLQFAWIPPEPKVEPVVRYASLRLALREGISPLAGVPVEISTASRTMEVVTGDDGRALAPRIPYGEVTVRVNLSGYSPREERVSVSSDEPPEVALSLRAIKKTAGLLISVVEADSGRPLNRATLTVRGKEYATDDQGLASLTDLPLGLIEVTAGKSGFEPASEIASVVSGKKSPLIIRLNPQAKKVPASISGIIRSDDGRPLAATLEIPKAKKKLKASSQGEFRLQIQPGSYEIRITAPGFLSQKKAITVKDGEETIFDVDLHPSRR